MTFTFSKPCLIGLFILALTGCDKNNDPPGTGDFHHEEFFSNTAGEELSIWVNGVELACRHIGDFYIFQEDIVFTEQQLDKASNVKGAGLSATSKFWDFATVYYTIEEGFPDAERVHSALAHWKEHSPLTFIERSVEDNYIEFIKSLNGTASHLGMKGGKQNIWVADWASAGNVIHEIGHAVGLYHEHSKPNRDDHILIHPENFESSKASNFRKLDQSEYTEGFDFSSIMLYGSLAGSINGEATITRLDGSSYLAQRNNLSAYDIEMIEEMYDDFDCFDCTSGQLMDIDTNRYKTVKIGDQWWMAENLATTKLNDGTEIAEISDQSIWISNTTGAYCWYENDEETYKQSYGALYNYYIVENDKLCPEGWRVPYDSDWLELEAYLGMDEDELAEFGRRGSDEGGKLKADGYSYWYEPNTGASNESNFTALPGGYRYHSDGDFYDLGSAGYFWGLEFTELGDFQPVYRELGSTHSTIARYRPWEASGYSVRCIKN